MAGSLKKRIVSVIKLGNDANEKEVQRAIDELR